MVSVHVKTVQLNRHPHEEPLEQTESSLKAEAMSVFSLPSPPSSAPQMGAPYMVLMQ